MDNERIIVPKIRSHKLKVSREIIKKSAPEKKKKCMLANAIREQIRGACKVAVGDSHAKYNVGIFKYTYELPGKVVKMIEDYDNTGHAEPFNFVLPAANGSVALVKENARKTEGD